MTFNDYVIFLGVIVCCILGVGSFGFIAAIVAELFMDGSWRWGVRDSSKDGDDKTDTGDDFN